jgi:hypothetical protein
MNGRILCQPAFPCQGFSHQLLTNSFYRVHGVRPIKDRAAVFALLFTGMDQGMTPNLSGFEICDCERAKIIDLCA